MVRIVACLIWYDENPRDLHEMCLSLAGFVDGMVALDGAFETFPHKTAWSPHVQWDGLLQGCAAAGIELHGYQPVIASGNEVEKRNRSLWLASVLQPDWVVAVDADMRLESGAPAALPVLAKSKLSVAETLTAGSPLRNMFRWTPTLRYVNSHYTLIDGDSLIAWPRVIEAGRSSTAQDNPLGQKQQVEALDLSALVRFAHVERRDPERRARQNAWYTKRDAAGLERLD